MLETKVLQFCKRHQLIKDGARILVATSGGPDSLALLHYLVNLKEKKDLTIVAAHVDHMFRGEQSYEDLLFVENYCQEIGIEIESERINVPKHIELTNKSTQVAARDCRYEFFERVMKKHNLDFLALGHHGDDQVETIVMRLTRGSTGSARGGIPIRRKFSSGEIIRPFLAVSKDDIEQYCLRHDLKPRYDASNELNLYVRNRIRNEVLPSLQNENKSVHEHFQRFSEQIYEDEQYIESQTKKHLVNVIKEQRNDKIVISISKFLLLPNSLQRRGIQLILNYLYNNKPTSLSAVHIEQVNDLLKRSQPSGELHFPQGLYLIRSYDECIFQFNLHTNEEYYFEINKPTTILLPNGLKLKMEFKESLIKDKDLNKMTYFDPREVELPLIVRTRKAGDRIIPKGMTGSKKLKSIFIEEKVPLMKRDEWPVVTSSEGEIIWLPQLKKSSKESLMTNLPNYIVLTIE